MNSNQKRTIQQKQSIIKKLGLETEGEGRHFWRRGSLNVDLSRPGQIPMRPVPMPATVKVKTPRRARPSLLARALHATFPFLKTPAPLTHPHVRFDNTKDFLFVPDSYSVKRQVLGETVSLLWAVVAGSIAVAYVAYTMLGISPLTLISGSIAIFYFLLMVFKLWMVYKSLNVPFVDYSKEQIAALKDEELPVYTIFIPLVREEKVMPQIKKAMTALDYPADKLDIIITLEEYDHATIQAVKEAGFPDHFKTLILPNVNPKSKPKALNVALLQAKGEFFVIYDAEIVPDPDQLKKAYLAFKNHREIAVFQTRLDHYNVKQSFLTRLFNAEFSFYYDLFLPGLQKMDFPIPLSGHSTHFRMQAVRDIGAWDPYNMTEDCDVGIRLYRKGYRSAIMNSVSREEAAGDLKGWIMQRTRWMKGFIQTSIVHLRHPFEFKRELGSWKNFIAFIMVVPASVAVNIFNLVFWVTLILWVTIQPAWVQALFPGPILYLSVTSFIVGNLIFTFLNLVGVYKRGRFSLVKYTALSPIYWILLAIATVRAAVHLIIKPHHWEKTIHGTHLESKANTL